MWDGSDNCARPKAIRSDDRLGRVRQKFAQAGSMDLRQSALQIFTKGRERVSGRHFGPSNQHIVPSRAEPAVPARDVQFPAGAAFARLRATAFPTFLEQVKPTRAGPSSPLRSALQQKGGHMDTFGACCGQKILDVRAISPSAKTPPASRARLRSRRRTGVSCPDSQFLAQALSDLRPRARRAFRILRPAFVAIRARKPWRRLRTRFEG